MLRPLGLADSSGQVASASWAMSAGAPGTVNLTLRSARPSTLVASICTAEATSELLNALT